MINIIKIASICLIISYFITQKNRYNRMLGLEPEKRLTLLLLIILSVYCGLRTWYNDTVTYQQVYAMTYTLPHFFENPNLSFSRGWGFELVNSTLKTIGFSTQDYFLFFSFLTYSLYLSFLRKYSVNFLFSIFLFFTNSWFIFSVSSIKQCVAMGFCLWALSFSIEKKWGKFLFLVFIATLFHPYAFIYLLVPLMSFKPWTWKTYFYIIIFVSIGLTLSFFLGGISYLTELMGADYADDEFSGTGVNLFRVAVALVPTLLGFLYKNVLFNESNRGDNLFFNLCMLNGLIMFVGIFGTANYFARLANYFLPMQVIVLPWIVGHTKEYEKTVLSFGTIIGFVGFSYYENVIIRNFDNGFARITLFDYLSSHLGG